MGMEVVISLIIFSIILGFSVTFLENMKTKKKFVNVYVILRDFSCGCQILFLFCVNCVGFVILFE